MSDLTISLIALVGFGAGYVVGHIHTLMAYHRTNFGELVHPESKEAGNA